MNEIHSEILAALFAHCCMNHQASMAATTWAHWPYFSIAIRHTKYSHFFLRTTFRNSNGRCATANVVVCQLAKSAKQKT